MLDMTDARRLIAIRDLAVTLAGRQVVHDISFEIGAGEIVSLIGPNGAGKTTIARAVLGIVKSSGEIDRRPGLTIGYVPQRLHIEPTLPLTVRRLLSLTRRFNEAAIRQALGEVGAEGLIDRQAHELSGGEYQRVLLARALLVSPDLLILDEPIQGVDFAGQRALYQLIDRIRDERGCGVLLISHDLHLVMGATDKVVCVNHHVCCQGEPEKVAADPSYVALFGRRDAETLAVFRHHHDHTHHVSGEIGGEIGDENKTADPISDQQKASV